jgi:pyruvate dehydrogenase E2 component (dihydrolipoamide acetyltransferase)
MARTIDIRIPDLGDFADVEVIEVLVAAGDSLSVEDGLITLETDKATMDVPAPADGRLVGITVGVGDTVSTGDVIGTMEVEVDDTVAVPQSIEEQLEQGGSAPSVEVTPASETPPVQPVAGGGTMTLEVPNLGDFDDGEIIEVHIGVGDRIEVDAGLVTLETDKATMDVPAAAPGEVREVLVSVGDRVSKGSPIAVIDADAVAVAVTDTQPEVPAELPAADTQVIEAVAPAPTAGTPATVKGQLPPIDEAGFSKAHASPSVRKLARELGVDLGQVKGSGPKSRILHDDIKSFVKAILTGGGVSTGPALPQVPAVDFAKFGEIEARPLTRIQKISGPRLQASWINLPHVTQHDLADITELEARRQDLKGPAKDKGISLTPLAFIMKACVLALQEFPKANSSLSADGTALVYKHYYHLGFAADTENGLMVPVIRDADKMDVYELAAELGTMSKAARDGKLKGDQLQGASFTISSLGGIGGTAFTPIVNAPEVAILGVSRSTMQPVWNGTEFEPRLMLPLSFSYDHRVIDGAYAVRFTTFLCQKLADVDALLGADDRE